jgi:hypothetical protein
VPVSATDSHAIGPVLLSEASKSLSECAKFELKNF